MSTHAAEICLDKLLYATYSIVISNNEEVKVMSRAQEILKADIDKIQDEATIEKIRIFIMGILAQQNIDKQSHKQQDKR